MQAIVRRQSERKYLNQMEYRKVKTNADKNKKQYQLEKGGEFLIRKILELKK